MDAHSGPAPSCSACQELDAADGVADGKIQFTLVPKSRNERAVFATISRTQDRASDAITRFAGSMNFVYMHSAWFGLWIVINVGLFGAALVFDEFPFGLLTLIVSLEAIFLSTFVMLSQNRQSQRADVRSELDFENNVRAEIWAVHVGHKLGIDPDHVESVVQGAVAGLKEQMSTETAS